MADALVTVWADKFARGWSGGAVDVPVHPVMPLMDALQRTYETDAHFVPYVIEGELMTPRVNKGALKDEETGELVDGRTLKLTALVFDVDAPKGASGDVLEAWRADQDDLIEGLCDAWYECRGFYSTRGGYRLIWRLPEPLPPAQWRRVHKSMRRGLLDLGIKPDDLKDAQRCYRLPDVVRDGVRWRGDVDLYGLGRYTLDMASVEVEEVAADVFDGLSEVKAAAPLMKSSIGEGGRNLVLTRLLGWLRNQGADRAILEVHAKAHNLHLNSPPLPDAEVERTISSILTYEPSHDLNLRDAQRAYLRLGSEVEVAQYVLLLIEDRGVQVVADRGCLWRYIPDTGLWTVLDRPEMTRIVQAIDGVGVECGVNKTTGEPKYKPLKVSKALCDNVYALIGAFKARDGFFDAAPDALAFCNGVVTMGAGGVVSFEPKSPEWRQVHRLDFDWDEGAACPGFDRFLSEVVPDDCADLLREWFGCALLGRSTDFAKALVLVGEGANGKSTLLNVIRALMPDGSVEAVAPQLMAQEYRRAKLAGCRLNVVNELPATEILESEQVKAIISGDDIDARHIRMSPFSFKPRAGHVFAANELPGVRDMSRGFWRRWLVVPFAREFAEHEQDKGLSGRLIAGELPGVVASLVKAASAAVARGRFVEPAVASEEKTRWRHEADRVALFVSEKCSPCPAEDGCAAQQIHGAFTSWCTVNGYKPLNAVRFGKRLKRLGVTKVRTRDGARYGLEIKRGAHLSVV